MTDTPATEMPTARHVLHDLGFFGHYLHVNAGGRSGQQHILVKLRQNGDHMTQRDLQEISHISSGSLSEVLAKLEGAGLIRRTRSDEDRRQLDIVLTDEGRLQADERIEWRRDFESRALSCLSETEQEQLTDMLDRLVDHWKGFEGRGECA